MDAVLRGVTLYTKQTLVEGDLMIRQGKLFSSFVTDRNKRLARCFPFRQSCHSRFRRYSRSFAGTGFFHTRRPSSRARARPRAAGYTDLCAMPNLNPPPDSMDHLAEELEIIGRDARVRVKPYACITEEQRGKKLVDFQALAPYVAGFSDDGRGVQSEPMMRSAMERVKAVDGLIAAHCEDDTLLSGGYIHDGEYARRNGYQGISSESEWRQLERDLKLAKETGCRYHMCHVSTKESVALIRDAKAGGRGTSPAKRRRTTCSSPTGICTTTGASR